MYYVCSLHGLVSMIIITLLPQCYLCNCKISWRAQIRLAPVVQQEDILQDYDIFTA